MFGILVFGDSIAFGRGESPNIGWAGRLKDYFEKQAFHNCLYNLSIPGESSTFLLERFEIEAKSRINYFFPGDKFVIILAVGINDSRGIGSPDVLQTKPDEFKDNINTLIATAKKYTEHVVILGLIPVDESVTNPFEDTYLTNSRIKDYDNILKKCAEEQNTLFIEILKNLSDFNKYLIDGVHPTKKGYEKIYNIIKDYLVKNKLIG